jgi:hypothetical protein
MTSKICSNCQNEMILKNGIWYCIACGKKTATVVLIDRMYQKREYCKDIGCEVQKKIEISDQYKQLCKDCKAHDFHNWLKKKGFEIILPIKKNEG